MSAKRCLFCGGKAELLCDSWLGWERKRGQMTKEAPGLLGCAEWGVPMRFRMVHTCDAPLCGACATPAGTFHMRLRNAGNFSDSIDYCPGHDSGDRRPEITGLQAQAIRAAWRAQHRPASADARQFGLFTGLVP